MSILPILNVWRPSAWPASHMIVANRQCHRGYHFEGVQENTLEAFRLAKAKGAQMIELDVRISRDGQVVVFHDNDLKRIAGDGAKVRDLTANELWKRAQVATLEKVLVDPKIPDKVNIEIKSESVFNDGLELRVAQVIQRCKATERVLISSFNPFCLRRFSVLLPQVLRALIVSGEKEGRNRIYLRRVWFCMFSRAHLLHLEQKLVTSELARRLSRRKIPYAVWTVNVEADIERFLGQGALSIISDQV